MSYDMYYIKCNSDNVYVINSRMRKNGGRVRRIECVDCGERFTTYEVYGEDYVTYKRFLRALKNPHALENFRQFIRQFNNQYKE